MRAFVRTATVALTAAAMLGSARADIQIGVAGPMTGPNAAYGQQYLAGVRAAVDKINHDGGVLGPKLAVVVGDDVSDPKQGVTVANNFVANQAELLRSNARSDHERPGNRRTTRQGALRRRARANATAMDARPEGEHQAQPEVSPRKGRDPDRQPWRQRLVGSNQRREG